MHASLVIPCAIVYLGIGITFFCLGRRHENGTVAIALFLACALAWPLAILPVLGLTLFERPKPDLTDDLPAIYGGDGSNPENAVILNCSAIQTAESDVERFISDRHGQKGVGWKPGIHFNLDDPDATPPWKPGARSLRCFTLTLADGSRREYFFDRTKAIQAAFKFYQFAGVIPKDL